MVLPAHEMRAPPSLASTPSNSDESLLLDVNNTDIESVRYKRPNCFAIFLARFPYLVALGAILVAGLCAMVPLKFKPFPDFGNKPLEGFEAHGTYISGRSIAQENLRNAIGINKRYSFHANISQWKLSLSGEVPLDHTDLGSHRQNSVQRKRRAMRGISYDPDACGNIDIDKHMFKITFESKDGSDLFSLKNFQAICDFEAAVVMPTLTNKTCPRMHSLPFYTSVKFRKPCRHLTEDDVSAMKGLLQRCYPYYEKKKLGKPSKVPLECSENQAVYKIFHYLTDVGFKVEGGVLGRLSYTALFYNQAPPGKTVEYYLNTFQKKDLSNDYVKVAAIFQTYNLKDDLFQRYLLGDLVFFGVALALTLVILTLYMRSFALMLALVGNVGASFVTAYTVYVYVFGIDFYPFINIISGLILIAIGADNVFVFYDAWNEAKKSDPNIPIENQVARTFNHAAVAITVTSLTTAASFYANCVTHIPAIRCFGVFAGTAVLANYIYMMTWTPAIITIVERTDRMLLGNCSCWVSGNRFMASASYIVCTKGLSTLIEKLWAVWLLIFCSLGIGGLIVVFYSPGLRLPTSTDFQLFPSSQPVERWDQVVRKQFRFSLEEMAGNHDNIQTAYIWGVVPVDNRRWSDPDDKGHLVEDASFNLFSAEAQVWLKKFTHDVVNQSFVSDVNDENKILSTFEAFQEVLVQYCDNTSPFSGVIKRYILACCAEKVMPFSQTYLQKCFVAVYMATSMVIPPHKRSGVAVFDHANTLKAFMIPVKTKEHYSTSYEQMNTINTMMDGFLTSRLSTAPEGLKKGFMSAYTWFNFYDLQQAISHGTYYSIAISLSVATVLMLITSMNVLVTIYAIVTITFAIAGTIGVLVLLGWHLNIIESITISLAVGLSIDFTIHYGVAYRLSKEKEPSMRVREGFSRVGSAVVMAALTTFVAGASVMPSHILAYSKLATFLMLVMSVSWLYATFFFQSLCRIIGPRGRFCQIPLPCRQEALPDVDLNGQDIYRQGDGDRANLVMDPLELEDDDNLLVPF